MWMDNFNDDTDDIDQTEDTVEFNPPSMISDGKQECSDERGDEETES